VGTSNNRAANKSAGRGMSYSGSSTGFIQSRVNQRRSLISSA
jgi:hypothetical protein